VSDCKRRMGRLGLALFVCFLLPDLAVSAETVLPSHNCTAPLKQREFATQFQLDRYKSIVDLYRTCLDAFVREQEQAIELHRQAIQNAIDDWNKFVGAERKQPSKTQEGKEGASEFRVKP
jgi:hypothetical protein